MVIFITLFNLISRSLLHNKGKNLIILCLFSFLFFILINVGITSIATKERVSYLNNSVNNMVVVEKNLGELFSLSSDGETTIVGKSLSGHFSPEEVEILTDDNYVKEYNINEMFLGFLNDAKPYVKDEEAYDELLKQSEEFDFVLNDCNLIGLMNSNYHLLFSSGGFKLIRGNHITANDKNEVAIISKQLADKNNLQLGDTIAISTSYEQVSSTTFKIIGLYEYVGEISSTLIEPNTQIENYIFAPYDILKDIPTMSYSSNRIILYLNDSSLVEEFKEKTSEKLENYNTRRGSLYDYKYTYDGEWFNTIGKPIQSVHNLTTSMVIILTIGTYVVILLISLLILIGKKREIGIYLSMGESKIKAIFQVIVEQMFIILLSLLIACGISFFAGENISKAFMNTSAVEVNKQLAQQRDDYKRHKGYYSFENELIQYHSTFFYVQDDINISSSIDKLIQCTFLGIIIIIVSLTCESLIFIHKNSILELLQY